MNLKEFLGLGYYTSPLDEFLQDYDKKHNKLAKGQKQEITKYHRIFKLRDTSNTESSDLSFWDKF